MEIWDWKLGRGSIQKQKGPNKLKEACTIWFISIRGGHRGSEDWDNRKYTFRIIVFEIEQNKN